MPPFLSSSLMLVTKPLTFCFLQQSSNGLLRFISFTTISSKTHFPSCKADSNESQKLLLRLIGIHLEKPISILVSMTYFVVDGLLFIFLNSKIKKFGSFHITNFIF